MAKCDRCDKSTPMCLSYLISGIGVVCLCHDCAVMYNHIKNDINDINSIYMSGKDVGIDYWERIQEDNEK